MMSTEKLLIGKPSDSLRELNAVSAFEQENPIIKPKESFGSIKEDLYLIKEFDVIDSCYIEGNSDIRSCILSFPQIKTEGPRKMIRLATDYALNNMGMQESFVFAEKEDKKMKQTLNRLGYESLGEEEKVETFVKDAEMIKERETIWKL